MTQKISIFVENQVKDLVENQHLQQWKVAKKLGIHQSTVVNFCKRCGIKTQRTGPREGADHTNWKGGKKWVGNYLYIYFPDHPYATKSKYVLKHRLIMEKKLGRYLDPKEVVHHIDGDSRNNDSDNLIVFGSNGKHLKHELTGKCPKWSQKGYENICKAHPEWKTNHSQSEFYDYQQPR